MRWRVRCSRRVCQARRTLRKHPDEYKRPPKCGCGSTKWRVDTYRMTREYPEVCGCDGYRFMHRPGSGDCRHNPMAPYRRAMLHENVPQDEIEDLKLRCVNALLRMIGRKGWQY